MNTMPVHAHEMEPDIRHAVAQSAYMDADWYRSKYRDVAASGMDPVDHFLRFGRLMRRNPSRLFDTGFYLDTYADSIAWQHNPLADYLLSGQAAGRLVRENQGRVALVAHVFHLDALPSIRRYLSNFPDGADQFVTCPDFFDATALALIARHFPDARIVPVPNPGQDVGALVSLARQVDLTRYDAICKIHTKKGNKETLRWSEALLRGVLGTRSQVDRILAAFRDDPTLVLAGAQQLYLHGPTYLSRNRDGIAALFPDLLGDFDHATQDWGFFSGTCFWIRGAALREITNALAGVDFVSATGRNAPLVRCAEGMFGIIATLWNGQVMLSDAGSPDSIMCHGADSVRATEQGLIPVTHILQSIKLPPAPAAVGNPRGALNTNNTGLVINGWLAVIGDDAPRRAVVRVDRHEIDAVASGFRADLKKNGINHGRHAFSVAVPENMADGKPHEILLIDAETGTEIARKTSIWEKPRRNYTNFQGFLKSSMIQSEIMRPFMEEDKRAFAVMEGIGNRMAARALAMADPPFVTVVMPMYNRAAVVGSAIASVLAQTYRHFELLVVDDGSTDDSAAKVAAIDDPRIRIIRLPANAGVSVARNRALREAKGGIIAYLDTDNTWDPRFLAAHVGALWELPDADMIYSGVLLYYGNEDEPRAVRYGHLHPALLENRNYIDTNVIVHRRSFLDRLGGFDETLSRYVDHDLALRAVETGRVFSVPVLLCNYCFDKADNTITKQDGNAAFLDTLRSNLGIRQSAAAQLLDRQDLARPVSVVIPSWQALDDIRDCIAALTRRDWKGMLQIIVVDNNSGAQVRDYLREVEANGHIILAQLERNYGFTHAVNVGIARARADADVLLLNNDAIAQPGALQALQAACLENPVAGMTVPQQILPAGTQTLQAHVPFARPIYDCDVNISAHHQNVGPVPLFHDGRALELTYAPFFAVYIRREVIDMIGPLDAEYGRHYRSDRVYSDMMYNLTPYRMFYTPKSRFIHKLQRSTDHLREHDGKDTDFDLMFRRNRWDADTAQELGFRFAPWDVF